MILRYIKYLFLIVLAICLLVLCLANGQIVTLTALTPELEQFSGLSYTIDLPLYFVALGGVAIGLLIGFIWEWLRESKHRAEVTKRQQQVRTLKREMIKMKGDKPEHKDDVLALLEEKPTKAG
ncbi:MAG: LapA family protein [Pseudomonadota bacterium]